MRYTRETIKYGLGAVQCLGLFLSLIAADLALVSCGKDHNDEPEAAQALWEELQTAGYRTWDRAPGFATRQPSHTAHSNFVDIYVNDILHAALTNETGLTAWPDGSIIAKDGFSEGENLSVVAVMRKTAGVWFFAEYDGGGDAEYSGRPGVCLDCHTSTNDGVRAFPLP